MRTTDSKRNLCFGAKIVSVETTSCVYILFLRRNYCLSAKYLYLDTPDPDVELGTYKKSLPRYPGPRH